MGDRTSTSGAGTSSRLRRAAAAELVRLARARDRLTKKAGPLREQLKDLDAQITEVDRLTATLLKLTGGEVDDPPDTAARGAWRVLNGAAIAEVAVRVLRAAPGGTRDGQIHYRDWYALYREAGYDAAGRKPLATFLSAISRSPVVRAAVAGGTYEIDRDAPARLERELQRLQLELQQVQQLQTDLLAAVALTGRAEKVAAARARRDEVTRKITRTEKALEACHRALSREHEVTVDGGPQDAAVEPPAAAEAPPAAKAVPAPASRELQEAADTRPPVEAGGRVEAAGGSGGGAPPPARAPEPLDLIVYEVARRYGASREQVLGRDRTNPGAVTARHVAMSLARSVAGMSYAATAEAFGEDEQTARLACELTAGFMLDDIRGELREALGISVAAPVRRALTPTPALRIQVVIDVAVAHFATTRSRLLARDRSEPAATARLIAMRLACEFTDLSYPQIGKQFGRHHSTIISAWDSAARLPKLDEVRQQARAAIAAAEGDAEDLTATRYQDTPAGARDATTAGAGQQRRRRARPPGGRRPSRHE